MHFPAKNAARRSARLILALSVTALVHSGQPPTASGNRISTGTPARHGSMNIRLPVVSAQSVSPQELARLPKATTTGRLDGQTSVDPEPYAGTDGLLVHPTRPVPVFDRPGGRPLAALPIRQIGDSPTWVPVIAQEEGWLRVLLPSRPNHAAAWIANGKGLERARTDYVIRVSLTAHRLSVFKSGSLVGSWTVGAGAMRTPTPVGRTFLLAQTDKAYTYSPFVLPLGFHSETLDTFGGGPATIAIHGWPDKAVFGRDLSNGCIRIPNEGLRQLLPVPLGSLVIISE